MGRYLAGGAALWAVVYSGGYVAVIHNQDDGSVAWWYLGLVLVAAAALLAFAAGLANRSAAIIGLVLLVCAALLALLSIGVFLLPAVAAAGVAVALAGPASAPAREATP
jgi:hypothetical protein